MANATFRVFRLCWNNALKEHEELGVNPCIAVQWFTMPQKRASIGVAGLPDLYARVAASDNPVRRDLWLLLLFSGLRRRSAQSIRTEHVDLERKVLHVARTKGDRPFDLPLSGFLCDVLKARIEENSRYVAGSRKARPWLFPSMVSRWHIEDPHDATLGITPHDCRRLFITVAESVPDASPYSIKLLVNHAVPRGDVTAGYLQTDVERSAPGAGTDHAANVGALSRAAARCRDANQLRRETARVMR